MLTRAEKQEQVAELREKLGRAKSVYVADYRGLDVQAVDQLRRRIRSEGQGDYEYRVTKNTLLRRAVEGSDVAGVSEHFQGPTVIALSYGDPVGLAKILSEFSRDHEVFELKGGVVEGQAVGADGIRQLATLPSLEALRATLVGLIQAPARKLVRLVVTPGEQLARLIEARRAQQEEAGD